MDLTLCLCCEPKWPFVKKEKKIRNFRSIKKLLKPVISNDHFNEPIPCAVDRLGIEMKRTC